MPGVFELLKRGWDLYVKNVRSYYVFILLFLAASIIVNLVSTLYGPTIGTLLAKNWDEVVSFSFVAIPLFVILFYCELIILSAINTRLENRAVDLRQTFGATARRLLPAVGAYVLSSLASIAGVIVLVITAISIGKDVLRAPETLQLTAPVIIGVVAGIALLILGAVVMFWFFFGHLEALLAGKGPVAALTSSYHMIHGRWWALFGRVLGTAIIISTVVYLVNSIVDFVAVQSIMAKAFSASEEAQNVAKLTTSTVLGVLTAPWGYGITMVLYKAMK